MRLTKHPGLRLARNEEGVNRPNSAQRPSFTDPAGPSHIQHTFERRPFHHFDIDEMILEIAGSQPYPQAQNRALGIPNACRKSGRGTGRALRIPTSCGIEPSLTP